ncbi:MAG: alkaline phosphatase, partial [Myxococcota bacterium]
MSSRRASTSLLGLLATCLTLACGSADTPSTAEADERPTGKADGVDDPIPATPPKRIILLVGDGMGVAAVTGAAHASDDALAMLSMPHVGFMTTHEHEYVTTDSAASATAMASGTKTHFEGVGVAPGTTADDEDDEGQHLATIIDAAKDAGWRTGLISTTSIVDATPAAFAAHRAKRKSKTGIAEDLAASGVDVLLGGGRKFFDDRSDGQNLLNQMRENSGYSIAKTSLGLKRASGSKTRVVGLLHESDMPPVTTGERVMALPTMVGEALEILDTDNDAGFFLMVEGAQIDRREHELDAVGAIEEARDFDAAVAVALDYARGRDDTLVVVTADHETGGMVIMDPAAAETRVEALGGEDDALELAASGGFGAFAPAFTNIDLGDGTTAGQAVDDRRLTATFGDMSLASRPFWNGPTFAFRAAHTPVMVPLFAEGTGAEFVARTTDNAELGQRLRLLAEAAAAGGGDADPPAPDETTPKHVVLVVSDLIGLPALTAAHYNAGQLQATQLPVRGLVAPVAVDRLVPDAAAAATAIATGARTEAGQLSTRDGDDLTTLLEAAERAGRRTGIVTTGRLTDVTAGAFFGHDASGDDGALAEAAVGFEPASDGLDVVFAGGG